MTEKQRLCLLMEINKLKKRKDVIEKEKVVIREKIVDNKKLKELEGIIKALLQNDIEIAEIIGQLETSDKVVVKTNEIVKVIEKKIDSDEALTEEDIIRIIKENIRIPRLHGGGTTKLAKLTDVNLDNAEQDEYGRYIIGSGGSNLGLQNVQCDYSQSDYSYIGGTNKNGDFQINRYSKTEPITREYALGDWGDRYSLTYEAL